MDALYTVSTTRRVFFSGCMLTVVSLEVRLFFNLQRLGPARVSWTMH